MASREADSWWTPARTLMVAGGLIAVTILAAGILMSASISPAPKEVVMTGAEFAGEYNGYRTNITNSTKFPSNYFYNFKSLAPGDTLKISDRIEMVSYINTSNATYIVLKGFENCPAIRNGLYFAGNLSWKFLAGDMVEITFHVVKVERKASGGNVIFSGEVLDEWTGPAREKSRTPSGITPGAIRKI